ncbi:hypothetical protein VNO77_03188 [Canavalia gladiata]|uniref:Uncharacterized protein n=1 Tax=Canavalia gladiata TaxID=3824 RepID=A0AAN9R7X1_CANGL
MAEGDSGAWALSSSPIELSHASVEGLYIRFRLAGWSAAGEQRLRISMARTIFYWCLWRVDSLLHKLCCSYVRTDNTATQNPWSYFSMGDLPYCAKQLLECRGPSSLLMVLTCSPLPL